MRQLTAASVYVSGSDLQQVMSLTLPLSPLTPLTMPPRTSAFAGASALKNCQLKEDGSNWVAFKLRARGLLATVWHVIEPIAIAARGSGEEKKKAASAAAAEEAAADAAEKSEYACGIIAQLLPDDMLLVVQQEMEQQDAAAVWRKLVAHFERKTTASKARIRSQLHNTTMLSGEMFDFYKSRVLLLAMQLKGMGDPVSEEELVHVLMKGLPNYYAAARDALQMQDALTVESVSDKLRDVIERKEMERDEVEERVNFAGGSRGGRGGGGGKFHRGGQGGNGNTDGRTAASDYMKNNSNNMYQERDNQPMEETQHRCALCRACGHWERFCPHRRASHSAHGLAGGGDQPEDRTIQRHAHHRSRSLC